MFQQNLRKIQIKEVVHPPWEIPIHLFGPDEIMGIQDGQIITIKIEHAYQLKCRHIIKSSIDQGGICEWCLAEANNFYPSQAEWLSLHCKSCFHLCSQALCVKGLCSCHGIQIEGNWFCPVCFTLLQKEFERRKFSMNWGSAALKSRDFCKSLFFK